MSSEPAAEIAPWTISRLLAWTTSYFQKNNLEDARLSAEVLLAHVTGWKRIEVYTRFEQVLPDETLTRFRDLVRRAAAHEPIAYLVGEKEFYSLPFKVTRDVLIPRAETETLVECLADHARRSGLNTPRVWDLGTGSGCIAISLLKQLAQATALATDRSEAALAIARTNAERHGLLERMQFACADGLAISAELVPPGGFDILVSNPPYVPSATWDTLQANIREYEPRGAVTDDADGLTFYRMIARDARPMVAPTGIVAVEIGDDCAEPVSEVFQVAGGWRRVGAWKDRTTGRERVMIFSPA